MKTLTCPDCKKGVLREKHGEYKTVYTDRNGLSETLSVPGLSWLECDTCAEVVLDDRAMSLIEAARRKALGLLSPEEIRNFRLRLRKTQVEMSELLGIGEKTYCRWESGSYLQSEASDRYLRLLIADKKNVWLIQQMSYTKNPAEFSEESDEARRQFTYVSDLHTAEDRGRLFVDLLSRGALYATQ